MNNIPEIKIESVDTKLKKIDSLGYTRLPQDSKNQNRNTYLDGCVFLGEAGSVSAAAGDITPSTNSTKINFTNIVQKVGNTDFKINSNGGLVIPKDGSYNITLVRYWFMYTEAPTIFGNTSSIPKATVEAEYGLQPVIAAISIIEEDTSTTPTNLNWLSGHTFYTLNDTTSLTFSGTEKKNNTYYVYAAHRRLTKSFPVMCVAYITKLS